jgi:cytochrome c biogenesis protein CcmG/thiol:disulfide interchange protein DsbE
MRRGARPPWAAALAGLPLLALAGSSCREPPAPTPAAEDRAAKPAAGRAVELTAVSYEAWQRELASRRGHVVVVDHWATWCVPCLERFPRMVALSRAYGPRGVRFLSLCLDDRDDPEALDHARGFLSRQAADFPHFLMDEPITAAFEKLDLLGIPAVFVYGRDGALRHRLTGDDPNRQFTDDDVEAAIRSELGAAGPG